MLEVIENNTIILSKLKLTDSEELFEALVVSRNEISPWLSWLTPNYSLENAKHFVWLQIDNWNKKIEYTYSIKNKAGDFLGVVSLHMFDSQNDVASTGYWIRTDYTNQGFCTEALKLLVLHLFKLLNLIRIEVIVAIGNVASQQVALNAGAQYETVLTNRLRINGVATNANLYVFT